MSLSKPIINMLASYLQNLYLNPIKTKSLTSAVIGASGNLVSQLVVGGKINIDSVIAFGLFGLFFGGSVPHYFYTYLERAFPRKSIHFALVKQLLFERLVYAPVFQLFSLYTLSRLEGKSHDATLNQLSSLYWPVMEANWRFLTMLQVINLTVIPPVFRVLFVNLIGFFWAMYLAGKRRQAAEEGKKS